MICSDSPAEYTSAVSMKLMPASRACRPAARRLLGLSRRWPPKSPRHYRRSWCRGKVQRQKVRFDPACDSAWRYVPVEKTSTKMVWSRAAGSAAAAVFASAPTTVHDSSGNSAPLPPERQDVGVSSATLNRASVSSRSLPQAMATEPTECSAASQSSSSCPGSKPRRSALR